MTGQLVSNSYIVEIKKNMTTNVLILEFSVRKQELVTFNQDN